MANPTWEESEEYKPTWEESEPAKYTAPPLDLSADPLDGMPEEERKVVEPYMTDDDKQMINATRYYDDKFSTNHTPEMVQAQVEYEYGENATAAIANQKNNIFIDAMKYTGKLGAGAVAQMPTLRAEMGQLRDKWVGGLVDKFGIENELVSEAMKATVPNTPFDLANKAWGMVPAEKLQKWGAEQVEQAGAIQSEHMSGVPLEESLANKDWATAAKDIGTAIAFESPMMAVQIAAGLASPEASLEIMGARAMGAKRAEKDAEDSLEERVIAPIAVGAVEIASEKLLGTGRIIDKMAAGKLKKGIVDRFKDILGGAVSEGSATFGENVVDRLSGEERKLTEGVLMSSVVGSIMDLGAGSMMTLGDANRMRKQNTDAEVDQAVANGEMTQEVADVVKTPEGEREAAVEEYNAPDDEQDAGAAEEGVGATEQQPTPKPTAEEAKVEGEDEGEIDPDGEVDSLASKIDYPLAPRGEWYGESDYQAKGGRLVEMTPAEFLEKSKPLEMDEETRENVDELKDHMESGRTIDPLNLFSVDLTDVKASDGRHRAIAASELGYDTVPVIDYSTHPAPKPTAEEAKVEEITQEDVEVAPLKEISSKAQKILNIGEKIKEPFRKFTSMTTRIKEIAPKIVIGIKKADQKAHKIISANTQKIVKFAESVKTVRKNITKQEWKTVKAEILNGDWTALEARGIEGMAELRQMFQQTADALGIKSIENYFRRKVKDYDGLIEHLGSEPKGRFKKALDAKRAAKGKDLTQSEKRAVIRQELKTKEGSGLGQKRTIDSLTPEMAEFYEDPLTELENYIRTSAQTIARKELLGIDQGVSDELGEVDPSVSEEDIASIIAEMSEEGMTRKQERELSELLAATLEYKRSPKFVDILRRLVSVKYVTKIKTTVKQWGDFFVTMAENGVANTFGSANEAKNWSDTFGNEVDLSLQEQGVEKLDAELQADKRKLIEEMIFKPLQSQDLLGKRILMRSTAMKWRRMSKSDPAKLRKQLMKKFEHAEFVDGIIADMQSGTLSEDVSFALYSQMADFHPISHSEHIKLYIDHPILRPLFMLKSFAFKRYDRLYREGISQVIGGMAKNRAAAADNNADLRKEGAEELATGILGIARFMVFAVGGEMVIEKMYKEAMQALGFAPEEIPEDESWANMYIQEAGKIAPFIDPFALENAIERGDPMEYFDKAYDIPGPLGTDAVMDLIKHMRGTKDADVNKWKKDIPWFGELMWGAEQESREDDLMRKREKQIEDK